MFQTAKSRLRENFIRIFRTHVAYLSSEERKYRSDLTVIDLLPRLMDEPKYALFYLNSRKRLPMAPKTLQWFLCTEAWLIQLTQCYTKSCGKALPETWMYHWSNLPELWLQVHTETSLFSPLVEPITQQLCINNLH